MKTTLSKKKNYQKINVEAYVEEYMSVCVFEDLLTDHVIERPLNEYQEFLFNRLMYGLDIYEPAHLERLYKDQRKRIIKRHVETREILNQWRCDIVYNLSNSILSMFSQRMLEDKLKRKPIVDLNAKPLKSELTEVLSFQELGITRTQIIEKLIKSRILPSNFYELDGSSNQKFAYHGSTNNS